MLADTQSTRVPAPSAGVSATSETSIFPQSPTPGFTYGTSWVQPTVRPDKSNDPIPAADAATSASAQDNQSLAQLFQNLFGGVPPASSSQSDAPIIASAPSGINPAMVIIIVLVVAGGVYWYMKRKKA